jgi:hypothetical protein
MAGRRELVRRGVRRDVGTFVTFLMEDRPFLPYQRKSPLSVWVHLPWSGSRPAPGGLSRVPPRPSLVAMSKRDGRNSVNERNGS